MRIFRRRKPDPLEAPGPVERRRAAEARAHLEATLAGAEGEAFPTPQQPAAYPAPEPGFVRCCVRRVVAPSGPVCGFCGAVQPSVPAGAPPAGAAPASRRDLPPQVAAPRPPSGSVAAGRGSFLPASVDRADRAAPAANP